MMSKKRAGMCFPVLSLVFFLLLFSGCDLYQYGRLGGADKTATFSPATDAGSTFDDTMFFMSGVWYSRYAGVGRLDSYRIGQMRDFERLVEDSGKAALFPKMARPPETYSGNSFTEDDYFVLYDDTVYGQSDEGTGGGGLEGQITRYIGIVRAVNVFNGDPNRGAIIIEYLEGCAPGWLDRWPESSDGKRPFFGIYYRVLGNDTVQMANAVDLEALYAGKKYYTETETLEEATALNSVGNEAEFISWGVVIPQDREE